MTAMSRWTPATAPSRWPATSAPGPSMTRWSAPRGWASASPPSATTWWSPADRPGTPGPAFAKGEDIDPPQSVRARPKARDASAAGRTLVVVPGDRRRLADHLGGRAAVLHRLGRDRRRADRRGVPGRGGQRDPDRLGQGRLALAARPDERDLRAGRHLGVRQPIRRVLGAGRGRRPAADP